MFTIMLIVKYLGYLVTFCFLLIGAGGIISLKDVIKEKQWGDTPTMLFFIPLGLFFFLSIYTWQEEGHKRAIFWDEADLKPGTVYSCLGEKNQPFVIKSMWTDEEGKRFPVWLLEEGTRFPQAFGLKEEPVYKHFTVGRSGGKFVFCEAPPPKPEEAEEAK